LVVGQVQSSPVRPVSAGRSVERDQRYLKVALRVARTRSTPGIDHAGGLLLGFTSMIDPQPASDDQHTNLALAIDGNCAI